jgi:hypothetical protein
MTYTGPKAKENLQKQEKVSRQSPRCKQTRKAKKAMKISTPPQHDDLHRATMDAACLPRNHKK